MSGNTFGTIFKVTTFGESHGKGIGVVVDGVPSGLKISIKEIQKDLNLRRPGQNRLTTSRNEKDQVEIISGLFNELTTGAPIAAIIFNNDQRSEDYEHLKDTYRPSHADFVYEEKFGIRDYRGGGRSSARETAARVIAGSIAKQILKEIGIDFFAYVAQIGEMKLTAKDRKYTKAQREKSEVRCPNEKTSKAMIKYLEKIKKEGDTVGGVIHCVIKNTPVGLGEPVFDKLHADLAKAMMSINAAKGFEIGDGFLASSMRGSIHNDSFVKINNKIKTKTNHSGGIQGGISNGMDIVFNVAFKPVATLMKDQETLNKKGKAALIKGKGRHDPCVVPRAVVIVEAMAAITILDHYLRHQTTKLKQGNH